ncbi:uncharacterized protein HKW66_Vig0250970 [Vigna angularis]|uniref:Uncharacterized protein n=1 Tax=Phaseolus angularis TaxID=3914 RepID=A0A8T0KSB5_PHAAN|nr:uncharacterized protein HKW66_Vig0250970 [Vigna angularis]
MNRNSLAPRLPRTGAAALGFDLCVNVCSITRPRLPKLRFFLAGKSVLSPPTWNYFIEAVDGVKCLAVQAISTGFWIFYDWEFDATRVLV